MIERRAVSLVSTSVLERMAEVARSTAGCIVEVGVYQGGSAEWLNEVAVEQGRTLYLYDTFTGIPFQAPIDSHIVGDFSDCSVEQARAAAPSAIIVCATFPACDMPWERIGFAHIDCDQYQSVKDCCLHLGPLMAPGGVMWFDDWCLDSAKAAIEECFAGRIESEVGDKVIVRF